MIIVAPCVILALLSSAAGWNFHFVQAVNLRHQLLERYFNRPALVTEKNMKKSHTALQLSLQQRSSKSATIARRPCKAGRNRCCALYPLGYAFL